MFLFEERAATMLARGEHLGARVREQVDAGRIRLHQIDPAELAPDEFTTLVRQDIDEGVKLVVIDSLSGYFAAMPDARFLALQIHELLAYLAERGVATIMTLPQSGLFQGVSKSVLDASYLADTVVLLRYFEAGGRVHKAISVLKKRSGKHEDTIRELSFSDRGVEVGEPITEIRGVLAGVPVPDMTSLHAEREETGDGG